MIINFLQKIFTWIYTTLSIRIELSSVKQEFKNRKSSVNLNVGAGSYHINGFISLDIETEHYKKRQDRPFKIYDIRSDDMPFKDNSVDNIYVSHVLEHIEKEYIQTFFIEAARVLKKGGVLRICVPDGKFLYQVSMVDRSNYWKWRNINQNDEDSLFQAYIREVISSLENLSMDDPKLFNRLKNMQYDELRNFLINLDIKFDYKNPGNHIHFFDEGVLREYGAEAGLTNFIVSKKNGSVSNLMTGADMDLKHPRMTLYGEFIK